MIAIAKLRNMPLNVDNQIIIGTTNESIREKTMIKNCNVAKLRQRGMKYDSSAAGKEKCQATR